MHLKAIFTNLLQRIGFTEDTIDKHWADLEKAYTGKARHYHNLTHLEEMIACYDEYKTHLQFPDEVLYSIFYHDIVYKSTRKDNELKSAEIAIAILPERTMINKELVYDMILATKDHRTKDVEDEKWLIDFDLRILAKDWTDYKTYTQQIRKEYNIYPDFLYKPGRIKALEHFLEKECIYQTQAFRTLYESKARQNVEKEIRALSNEN